MWAKFKCNVCKEYNYKHQTIYIWGVKVCSVQCRQNYMENKAISSNCEIKRTSTPKKISEKRKERLKSGWWEAQMFKEIWDEVPHVCEICNKTIPEPLTFSFAHKCPKWTYPEHRLKKENISLVCSIKCHWEVDKIFSWIKRAELHFKLKG